MSGPTHKKRSGPPKDAVPVEDMVVITPLESTEDPSEQVDNQEAGLAEAKQGDGDVNQVWADLPSARPTSAASALWEARAIRYLAIYLLLSAGVLTLRYTTQSTYPQLRELRQQVADLQTQRDTLDLQVQQLTTGPRVLAWAQTHGMIPYAQARKQSQSFPTLSAPATPMPSTPLEVSTQWK